MPLTREQFSELLELVNQQLFRIDMGYLHQEALNFINRESMDRAIEDTKDEYAFTRIFYQYLQKVIYLLESASPISETGLFNKLRRNIKGQNGPLDGIKLLLSSDLAKIADASEIDIESFPNYRQLISDLQKILFQLG